jgi:hypothetical protein
MYLWHIGIFRIRYDIVRPTYYMHLDITNVENSSAYIGTSSFDNKYDHNPMLED